MATATEIGDATLKRLAACNKRRHDDAVVMRGVVGVIAHALAAKESGPLTARLVWQNMPRPKPSINCIGRHLRALRGDEQLRVLLNR